ncbi:glutamyl-tRNA reductase [Thermosyntropha lipolytica DSM 11003]|uniref:Glutamyl-tRNA reductase n=1 Tax=Thermosyntropha lipolytica DSM 11003 TaxID=1123382 RepID=A0A1M5NJC2_9FIRM|nr:glutamyl-tRNA reductase [Thermosyntropha lipolytica]SHG89684.1 glutamyl-tRNA reductase [Thermosyntropha lipolytica DSM 11003]
MYILLTGLSYRTAPVEVREKLALCTHDLKEAYTCLKNEEGIEGVVILSTCNRMEIYATTRDLDKARERVYAFLAAYSGIKREELKPYLYDLSCYDAIYHLFKVASGLDSMVLGETQILGQVKEAYMRAKEEGATEGVINTLFQKALYVGKRVRTETMIDQHPVSVSYAAVELARSILGTLNGRTVMLIGAGEMSELAAYYLLQNGASSVIVSNRSYENALKLAAKFNGQAVRFDEIENYLLVVDIVISCTAAQHYVMRRDNCYKALQNRGGKKIIMIDIAVPRDIDPELGEIEGVFIYDIDDLKDVIDGSYLARQKAAKQAQKIIDEEMKIFNDWLSCLYVVPVIKALRSWGEEIKQKEITRAFNRLGNLSEREKKIIISMANSIVNQLLHFPIVNLKEMALCHNEGHLYAEVVKKLFSLHIDEGEGIYDDFEVGN